MNEVSPGARSRDRLVAAGNKRLWRFTEQQKHLIIPELFITACPLMPSVLLLVLTVTQPENKTPQQIKKIKKIYIISCLPRLCQQQAVSLLCFLASVVLKRIKVVEHRNSF